ncbi:MAG TPA: AAA family ATPase [Candidatus Polarisedimenticolia bacterium]|nr:AAA family ATPase [Candidatus Polarisedimenticolia bacterium]
MIKRPEWLARIRSAHKRSRVTLLVGQRQPGKTTLARQIVSPDSPGYFDLEDPRSPARLAEPKTSLEPLRGIIVIDEIQRRPDLFPLLRVLSDRRPLRARFLILGSASPGLLRQSSETLAGRGGRLSSSRGSSCVKSVLATSAAGSSFRPFWNGTCRSSGSASRLRRCCVSGRCWLKHTATSGTRPIRGARSASASRRCAGLSIC